MEMTHFVNCLPENAPGAIALGLTIVHRRSGEERCVDALVIDDRLATVFSAIRDKFGTDWTLFESWVIDDPMMQATAA